RRDTSPDDCLPQHPLQQREGLDDRWIAHTFATELGLEALDHSGRQPAELHPSESRQHVSVPERRVHDERLRGQVRLRVCFPPLPCKVRQFLFSSLEHPQLAGLCPTSYL